MGRFYFCGFELIHKREIDGIMHFILRKNAEPSQDTDPTFGPFISLRREGKDGKPIRVLKLRTMHPYSEYLQVYAYSVLGSEDGDKATNDFRVTSWGKVMRKLWIDELPMLVNLFKGDLKLVGVRPLSYPKLELYPLDLRDLRRKYKPGLVPPFYAMLPKTAEGHFQTERDYLQSYDKSPFLTDWKYFWKSVWNILVKRARSN
jgi:lipopolysaccharide/colanic/teichoic acid biosynthesis glycosyltransferase